MNTNTNTAPKNIMARIASLRALDADQKERPAFALHYEVGREHKAFLNAVRSAFDSVNGLNPLAFPSAVEIERSVIAKLKTLLHGTPETCGTLTSGGTESIFLAMKTYRERFRESYGRSVTPRLLVAYSAHPAFSKAAEWLDLDLVRIPVNEDGEMDLSALILELSMGPAVAVVVSAPSYAHGIQDDIRSISERCLEHGTPVHVDACVGGMILPYLRELGEGIPAFDFELPGVTSLSVDLHKYGYAAKGVSALLVRNPSLRAGHYFDDCEWNGGIFATPGLMGTRSMGPAATAWACFETLGDAGYLELAGKILLTKDRIRKLVAKAPGLRIVGRPLGPILSIAGNPEHSAHGEQLEKLSLGLRERGWHHDRVGAPEAIHFTISPAHAGVMDRFEEDFRASLGDPAREEAHPFRAMNLQLNALRNPAARSAAIRGWLGEIYA